MTTSPPTADMLHLGVDENGLGPRLGPLVVTAAAATLDDGASPRVLASPTRGPLSTLLGDSKALSSFADSALGEAWLRVVAEHHGLPARSPSELLEGCLLDPAELRSPCPAPHAAQCWREDEGFVADDELLQACRRGLTSLRARGLQLQPFRSTLVCTQRINQAARQGVSRLHLDLHAMEALVLDQHARHGRPVEAVLGKVGGIGFYGKQFGPLAGRLHVVLEERRPCSRYAFPGLGTLSFVMDADASHSLVALASLVGKWVRDHFMRRILRHHEILLGEALAPASGYHDPVTARMVARTALSRQRAGFPDDCFERIKVPPSSRPARSATPD